jgi:hypothetical protein
MVTADVDCVAGVVAGADAIEDGVGIDVGAAGLVTVDEEELVPPAPVRCPNAIHCVPSCLGHLNAHAHTPG